MILRDLLRAIREHKGEVLVATSNFNDIMYVKVVKSDLIHVLKQQFNLLQETEFELDHNGYLDKDFSVM